MRSPLFFLFVFMFWQFRATNCQVTAERCNTMRREANNLFVFIRICSSIWEPLSMVKIRCKTQGGIAPLNKEIPMSDLLNQTLVLNTGIKAKNIVHMLFLNSTHSVFFVFGEKRSWKTGKITLSTWLCLFSS